MIYNIEVTQEDRTRGEERVPTRCPIAEAIKRIYPWVTRVSVDSNVIAFTVQDRKLRLYFATPPTAAQWLKDCDNYSQEEGLSLKLNEHDVIRLEDFEPGKARKHVAKSNGTLKSIRQANPRRWTRDSKGKAVLQEVETAE